jgi:hypothetical protein
MRRWACSEWSLRHVAMVHAVVEADGGCGQWRSCYFGLLWHRPLHTHAAVRLPAPHTLTPVMGCVKQGASRQLWGMPKVAPLIDSTTCLGHCTKCPLGAARQGPTCTKHVVAAGIGGTCSSRQDWSNMQLVHACKQSLVCTLAWQLSAAAC